MKIELTQAMVYNQRVHRPGAALDVSDEEGAKAIEAGKAVQLDEDDEQPAADDLSDLTVNQLKELADEQDVDVSGARVKADYVEALEAAVVE